MAAWDDVVHSIEEAEAVARLPPPPPERDARARASALREAREGVRLAGEELRRAFGDLSGGGARLLSNDPMGGWKAHGVKKGVERFTRDDGEKRFCLGRVRARHGLERMLEAVTWYPARFAWDDKLAGSRVVGSITPSTLVVEAIGKSMFGLSPRESCFVNHRMRFEDGYAIISRSVHHPRVPLPAGATRATVYVTAWVLLPVTEEETAVVYLAAFDPGGAIPQWVINRVLPDRPLLVANALEYMQTYTPPEDRIQRVIADIDDGALERVDESESGGDVTVDLSPDALPGWLALCRPLMPHAARRQSNVGRVLVGVIEALPGVDEGLFSLASPNLYCAVAVGPLPAAPLSKTQLELLQQRRMQELTAQAEMEARHARKNKGLSVGTAVSGVTTLVGGVVGGVFDTLGTVVGAGSSALGMFGGMLGVTGGPADITQCGWPDSTAEVLEQTGMPSFTRCHRHTTATVSGQSPRWDTTLELPCVHSSLSSCVRICLLESMGVLPGASLRGINVLSKVTDKMAPDKPVAECLIPLEDIARECHGGMDMAGRVVSVDRWVRLYKPGTCERRYIAACAGEGSEHWPGSLLSVPGNVEDPRQLLHRRGVRGTSVASSVGSAGGAAGGTASVGAGRHVEVDHHRAGLGWIRLRLAVAISSVADASAYAGEQMDRLALQEAVRKMELNFADSSTGVPKVEDIVTDTESSSSDSESDEESEEESEYSKLRRATSLRRPRTTATREFREASRMLLDRVHETRGRRSSMLGRQAPEQAPLAVLLARAHSAAAAELAELPVALRAIGGASSGEGSQRGLYGVTAAIVRASVLAAARLWSGAWRSIASALSWHRPLRSVTVMVLLTAVVFASCICDFGRSEAWYPPDGSEETGWLWWILSLQWLTSPLMAAWSFASQWAIDLVGDSFSSAWSGISERVSTPPWLVNVTDTVWSYATEGIESLRASNEYVNSTISVAGVVVASAQDVLESSMESVTTLWEHARTSTTDSVCYLPHSTDLVNVTSSVADAWMPLSSVNALNRDDLFETVEDAVQISAQYGLQLCWFALAWAVWIAAQAATIVAMIAPVYLAWWVWRGRKFQPPVMPGTDNRAKRRSAAAGGGKRPDAAVVQADKEDDEKQRVMESGIRHQITEVFGRSAEDEPEEVHRIMASPSGRGDGEAPELPSHPSTPTSPRAPSAVVPRSSHPLVTPLRALSLLADHRALAHVGAVGGGFCSAHRHRRLSGMNSQEATLAGGEVVLFVLAAGILWGLRRTAVWVLRARTWGQPVFSWTLFVIFSLLAVIAVVFGPAAAAAVIGLVALGWQTTPVVFIRTLLLSYEDYVQSQLELEVA